MWQERMMWMRTGSPPICNFATHTHYGNRLGEQPDFSNFVSCWLLEFCSSHLVCMLLDPSTQASKAGLHLPDDVFGCSMQFRCSVADCDSGCFMLRSAAFQNPIRAHTREGLMKRSQDVEEKPAQKKTVWLLVLFTLFRACHVCNCIVRIDSFYLFFWLLCQLAMAFERDFQFRLRATLVAATGKGFAAGWVQFQGCQVFWIFLVRKAKNHFKNGSNLVFLCIWPLAFLMCLKCRELASQPIAAWASFESHGERLTPDPGARPIGYCWCWCWLNVWVWDRASVAKELVRACGLDSPRWSCNLFQ